jgi:hypothetical protein
MERAQPVGRRWIVGLSFVGVLRAGRAPRG